MTCMFSVSSNLEASNDLQLQKLTISIQQGCQTFCMANVLLKQAIFYVVHSGDETSFGNVYMLTL